MESVARFSGERLRSIRLRRGLTQAQLARRAQLREQQINRWEGAHNVPSADAVGVLAGALDCDVSELYVTGDRAEGGDEDDEESDLFAAAHQLDLAGDYALANRLRARARDAARSRSRA